MVLPSLGFTFKHRSAERRRYRYKREKRSDLGTLKLQRLATCKLHENLNAKHVTCMRMVRNSTPSMCVCPSRHDLIMVHHFLITHITHLANCTSWTGTIAVTNQMVFLSHTRTTGPQCKQPKSCRGRAIGYCTYREIVSYKNITDIQYKGHTV
jgi:hypothetical protein